MKTKEIWTVVGVAFVVALVVSAVASFAVINLSGNSVGTITGNAVTKPMDCTAVLTTEKLVWRENQINNATNTILQISTLELFDANWDIALDKNRVEFQDVLSGRYTLQYLPILIAAQYLLKVILIQSLFL